MTTDKKPDIEPTPSELWLLRITNGDGKGEFVRAIDSAGDPVCAYFSLANANMGAKAALEQYEIECKPVRLGAASGQ